MSIPPSKFDDALRALGETAPPPPSPELLSLVGRAQPVDLRQPRRALGTILLASVVVLFAHLHSNGVRRDFVAVPKWWFFTTAAAWSAAFVIPLAVALVPPRGAIFVDARATRLVALAVPLFALALAIFCRVDAPPLTVIPNPENALPLIESCLVTGLEMAAAPFALGLFLLSRAPQPLQTRWIGAALGAGNGALTGLMLHVHCWFGGALHAGVAHAGHSIIEALLGALLVPALVARRPS